MMKSNRVSLVAVAASLLVVVLVCDQPQAREVKCKILQQKLGRLYFSAGKEEDIFPGCRWVVYRNSTDTTKPALEGKIAESYDGVSVSDSGVESTASANFATIHAADTAHDKIPVGISIDGAAISCLTADTFVRITDTRNLTHKDRYAVNIDYNQGDCDPGDITYSAPAPFFVTLRPNISRPINQNAFLTTALRYRVDTSRLDNVFAFEAIAQVSFLPAYPGIVGFGPDASKGKQLLLQNKRGEARILIDCPRPSFSSTDFFFRDILAQAGYATAAASPSDPADIRLSIVPIRSDSPQVALREVLSSLAADTVAGDKADQPLRLAAKLLDDAMQSSDSTQRLRLFQRVDRILQEDIGAFPLFRPIIHICAKEEIRGIRFDKDGRIDLRRVYRVKLPTDSTGRTP